MKINFKGEINTTENNASYIADQLENLTNQHGGDIDVQITTESDIMRLKMRIAEIVKDKYCINDDGGIEIYCDYNDILSDSTIKKIAMSDNSRIAFEDELFSWDTDYEWDDLIKIIMRNLTFNEKTFYNNNENEILDFLYDTYYFYYPEEHFNKKIKVNIMLDTVPSQ